MISVVIRVERGVEPLALTLRALVPGVAEGLVADAVVLAATSEEAIAAVVDAVGATLAIDRDLTWTRGAQAARRDWVLCLRDGDVPGEGWIQALERFVATAPPERHCARLASRSASWGARLRGLWNAREVRAGDIVRRSVLLRPGPLPRRPVAVAAALERADR